ncbi:translocator protein-like [Ptychodera flava]|uniref:translocator protein-like n=1 Tax=Ptychodera flava TaxID=63121 RepID=UPI003969F2CC
MDWFTVGIFIVVPFVGAAISSILGRGESGQKQYYKELKLPDWRPPAWLFGPVWTYLYTTMGIAAYLVWRDGGGFDKASTPLALYGISLILNWMWTPLFFGARLLGLASIEILMYLVSVVACIYAFHPVNTTASYLLVPLLLWVSFASCICIYAWRHNPDARKQE